MFELKGYILWLYLNADVEEPARKACICVCRCIRRLRIDECISYIDIFVNLHRAGGVSMHVYVCELLSSNAPAWHHPFRKLRQLLMRADRSLAEWL